MTKVEAEKRRRTRNGELCQMVKEGIDIPPAVKLEHLFFPQRPLIKKDPAALKILFGD